ncbi:serine phosphatase RsbU (regulator of sigma subunit) [Motilibacter rhizosphaerae]|uniref:Serine phosphatase RsbU (Regulator of sigma subunit) n=1 Tax=Motilibacter rhizosphaerae TaxID=598652 RepID=A0A4Q7NW77_9ACTN|nr:PP2C family protein-serine/threonine phosphatase [Motilibacter rhizosphaerae]RZS91546.1 serine phosphatase RsbU (regulator of sigma subunit) [Motilibacter rhizosphaerae]
MRSPRRAWLLTAALGSVVLITLVQDGLGSRLVVVPWLAIGPFAASLVFRWWTTLLVSVVSVGAVVLLSGTLVGDLDTHQGMIRVAGSTALVGFAVVSAEIRTRREDHIRRVTEVAAVAQATIIHPVPATVGGLNLHSRYVSASAEALVGGDLYDVVAVDSGVRLLLGDARGKGLEAVHTAAAVLSAFRAAAPRPEVDLGELARRVDAAIAARARDEDFVTAVLAEIGPDGALTLVNCGHPEPLRLTAGSAPEPLGSRPTVPLGLGVDPEPERFVLAPGDRLLLYTDGLPEARDRSGEFYDLVQAATLLTPRPGSSGPAGAEHALDELMATVTDHVGGLLTDDVAVLLVELPHPTLSATSATAS